MEQLGFDTFTHCIFATNELTSPYPARHYLMVKLSDDPDTDLKSRSLALLAHYWLTTLRFKV